MSYYTSNFEQQGDTGEYLWNPFDSNYESYDHNHVSTQASLPYYSSDFIEPTAFTEYCSTTYDNGNYLSVTPSEIDYSSYGSIDTKLLEYFPTTYDNAYDPSITPSEIDCSNNYSFSDTKLLEYYPTTYGDAYDPPVIQSEIDYSTYTFSEPKLINYEPTLYATGFFFSQTQKTVSFSGVEFDDTDFDEYDPTPYEGGYDPTTTYGKPLPPSDEICYPRSMPMSNAPTMDGSLDGSIPSPYGKDETRDLSTKSRNGGKASNAIEKGKLSNGDENKLGKPTDLKKGEGIEGSINGGKASNSIEKKGEEKGGCIKGDDSSSYGYVNGYGSGETGGYGYEFDKRVVPYGSGLEAMDLCETIFGYWPCLNRKNQIRCGNRENGDERSNCDTWKGAADYLFGSPLGYSEGRDGGYYGDSIYGAARYY